MKPGDSNAITRLPRVVVLISGSGSNLQALLDACTRGELKCEVAAVISNRPSAGGLERARATNIPALAVDHTRFDSRESFDRELARVIDLHAPELIILAGFMRILSPVFTTKFAGKLLNIHPSLLPKYPGLNTHQRAIDAGDNYAGATVHFVTGELDGGPAIIQARVPVLPQDTADQLAERVLVQEHLIYPLAAAWFVEGRLALQGNRVYLDGELLPQHGYLFAD
ncbi:MAG: phosphoribosylglycinamide formyltransferase [Pseudomonadales bacterium]|nr:phosphoribosylglycinamide formyltransferase [Gammaproteobacteria bacterium]NNL56609.1 phosphoribosylglycinamide formyltransferase [Pseudomonadales bacterium]